MKRKRKKSKGDANETGEEEKALVVVPKINNRQSEIVLTVSHNAFIGLDTIAHMKKDVSVIPAENVPSDISTTTAGRDTIEDTAQNEPAIDLFAGKKPILLKHVLHAPDLEHNPFPD